MSPLALHSAFRTIVRSERHLNSGLRARLPLVMLKLVMLVVLELGLTVESRPHVEPAHWAEPGRFEQFAAAWLMKNVVARQKQA